MYVVMCNFSVASLHIFSYNHVATFLEDSMHLYNYAVVMYVYNMCIFAYTVTFSNVCIFLPAYKCSYYVYV